MTWGTVVAVVLAVGIWMWLIWWLTDFQDSDFEEDEELEELWDKNT